MATITTVRQRLKEIVTDYVATLPAAYATKATVERYIPRQLNAAELPAFLILPADATIRKPSADVEETSRLYLVRGYIAPLEQGIENEIEEYAEDWADSLHLFLSKKPRLEDSTNTPLGDGLISATVESDGGLVSAQYPANVEGAPIYLMIEDRLRVVTRKWGIT